MKTIIKITNLQFLEIKYPNIEIIGEELTFITGLSGCGKSSLLKLINTTISKKSGEITYQDKAIESYNPIELRKEILLCSQSVYLFDKTIQENFNEYYEYRDMPSLSEEQIHYYLDICCLNFPLDTTCSTLSGGERHRVFIAICLSFLPKVLMLDEPTAALDEENSRSLIKNLKIFCKSKGITPIIICHNKTLVEEYADKIIKL